VESTSAKRMLGKKGPFSLCMIDVDNFKGINDGWGHGGGDTVLRERVAGLRFDGPLADIRVTVTIGLAQVHPTETEPEPALRRADEALYRGKRGGRNVTLAGLFPAEGAVDPVQRKDSFS